MPANFFFDTNMNHLHHALSFSQSFSKTLKVGFVVAIYPDLNFAATILVFR